MRYLVALLFLVGTLQITKAAPIAYEGFDYSAGKNLNGLNGGTGFKDAWHVDRYTYVIAEEALKDPTNSLSVSGKALRHIGDQPCALRNLAQVLGTPGTTVYLSFLLRQEHADHGGAGLILGGRNTPGMFGLSGLYIGGGGSYGMGSAGSAENMAFSGAPFVVGKSALLVARVDFRDGPDTATLYVNPTPGEPEPAQGTVYSGTDLGKFSQVAITQLNNSSWTTDEIRIATTWNEVIPKTQLQGLAVETANNRKNQSPSVFDALTQKLFDETVSKLKGAQAKKALELKQKYKRDSDMLAAQRADLGDEMQRAVLKVIALPGGKTIEVSHVELETLKAIDGAIEKAAKESDSTLAVPQCKKAVLAAVDKNNVWDEETRNRQFEIIYSAPAEKRKRLVGLYSKYEPKFATQIQREAANVEQYKKALLEIIAPDTGNEK